MVVSQISIQVFTTALGVNLNNGKHVINTRCHNNMKYSRRIRNIRNLLEGLIDFRLS